MKSWRRRKINREAIVKVKPMLLSDLPDDAILEILSELPVKDVIRFRCVCKSWDSIIADPHFAKFHRYKRPCLFLIDKRHLFKVYQEKMVFINDWRTCIPAQSNGFPRFMGSCNGLMCLQTTDLTFLVWNPCTRKFKCLPKRFGGFNLFWFGYDKFVDDYKLVATDYWEGFVYKPDPVSSVHVFTLKSNSWRHIITKDVNFGTGRSVDPAAWCGTLLDGNVHWLVSYTRHPNSETFITAFDLSTEKFKNLSQPDLDHRTNPYKSTIGALGGCLCLCYYTHESDYGFEMWIMKKYGVISSWTKLVKLSNRAFNLSLRFTPLYFAKEDEIVALLDDWRVGKAWIGRLNITNLSLRKQLVATGLTKSELGYQSCVHTESIASVDACSWNLTGEMKSWNAEE